ncbi:superinfection immunity protein [Actinomadura macrotermitis]|uniref:Superinfection immunity protein n=1 Tax=Actinomadura macrotermitis TaxID=2585200 RepID=A0A7K0BUI6_9ACTN|nr:superinfection immunity protein [Actinomadura macrotermitis]MQY04849.1 hypothetical protein [Actinomadura macrotermitis]
MGNDFLMTAVVAAVALFVYVLPAVIAFRRRSELRWIVLAIDIFFGGTLIGWVIALVLAYKNPAPRTA